MLLIKYWSKFLHFKLVSFDYVLLESYEEMKLLFLLLLVLMKVILMKKKWKLQWNQK